MANKKIEGLVKSKGGFGTTVYTYRGVQIKQGSGRFKSPYDFHVHHNDVKHRVTATNLTDATNQINKILGT